MLRPLDAHAPYDVGPYRLLGGLGSGGMGSVHLALPPDGGPDDLVALKTVRPDLELRPDFRLRFRREAEAARAVRSPYVSALVAADPDAERPWLATEYVVGPSLDEAVTRAGALPVPVVRELGADLARGLAAVHGARLVHRDLKPANVVLGARGPRLIDFGIAQAYDATALTATGIMVGSPGFMSPEHVAGDRSVTAASDVFCLGAVLCFAATGQGPFQDSELAAIVHRIVRGRPDLSGVPDDLRELIASCLHQEPGRRPTPGQVIRALASPGDAARPGVAPRPRSQAFPWPDGVARVIGEYEVAVAKSLLAPPSPQRAPARVPVPPAPAAEPPPEPHPEPASGPASGSASGGRRSPRLRWTLGAGAVLLVAVLAAILLPALSGGGQSEDTSADGNGSQRGVTAPPATDGTVVTSEMSDFGPGALDHERLSDGWSPWTASFDGDGKPLGCALSGTALVCQLAEDPDRSWLEARNADDGTPLWRYPAKDTAADDSRVSGLALDGGYAYAASARSGRVAVLRLTDGSPVAALDAAAAGYTPRKVRVHKGRLFVSSQGSAGDVLVRAFSTQGERRQVWDRTIGEADAASLDIVGDRVHINGGAESLNLSPSTGETVAKAPEPCTVVARFGPYLSCESGIRDSVTLKKVAGAPPMARPLALSRDGTVFTGAGEEGGASRKLVARDLVNGRELWAETWHHAGVVRVAGERVLALGEGGISVFRLADGSFGRTEYDGWSGALPTSVLISDGACYLTFDDGTVLSAFAP
ncbi:serine/threonine-protein kinase [Streptomyces sp. O3]